jgi:hypothetical protein
MSTTDFVSPSPSAELRRLVAAELSLPSRIRYVGLLLVAVAMTVLVLSLLLTEPSLPVRAQIAFAVLAMIGLSWTGFATWVLTRRRALFAYDKVIAGRMAVLFTCVFLGGAVALGLTTGRTALFAAAALGVVMLGGAVVQLVRAQRTFAALTARRDALAREIEQDTDRTRRTTP